MKRTVPSLRRSLSLSSMLATLMVALPAVAQPAASRSTSAAPNPAAQKEDPLVAALAPQSGGLTPDDFAKAALQTHASLRVKQAELREAAAKVDQAIVNFFPRVTLTASYARLSEVETESPAGIPPEFQPLLAAFDTSSNLNAYSFTAQIAVPISDYVLRISQGYAAASHGESAKALAVQAESLQIAADAKVTYYNWLRFKGQEVVAKEAVSQAKAHLVDARRTFEVGLISRADVLRLEAQVASAEQLLGESQAALLIADEQVRIALGAPPEKPLLVGIDVMGAPPSVPPPTETLQALQQEALQKRLDIRALDETELSLKKVEAITKAGYLPRVDAFADLTYANPNQRIFPQKDEFTFTWTLGIQASWVLNDVFTTLGASAEANARTTQVAEQKAALRDGLRVEVAAAYADVSKATKSIDAAERQLAASVESMRVKSELFRAGRATSTDVVDSENEVTRARQGQINARINALSAKIRLEHAVGRDVKDVK